jgi:hypothetical protein
MARDYRRRGLLAVKQELETVDGWDPAGMARDADERWRQEQLAQDRSGDLHRARIAAEKAMTIARTPDETFRATELLARIECDLGRHEVEFQQSQRLIALQPQDPRSLLALRHAAYCTGRTRLARRTEAALRALGR